MFVLDLNGFMAAQPKNPKAVGEYLLDKPDTKGKLFRKEIIEKAKTEGSGWVDYFATAIHERGRKKIKPPTSRGWRCWRCSGVLRAFYLFQIYHGSRVRSTP